ncbi:MAG: hypothetical protein F4181_00305 [Proteobacteria bacterium]|nr:hypothetical protein [Pseudomonadota bacterium]
MRPLNKIYSVVVRSTHSSVRRIVLDAVELPEWLEMLRRVEVTDRVRNDPRSQGDTLFGLDMDQAFAAIGGGQADFNTQCGDLSPDDLALLYAYQNQKGHLEELVSAFGQLLAGAGPVNPIVVDIGCGPFTGGLALAATLGDDSRFDYIGVDRADSMRQLGARLASSDFVPGSVTTHWTPDFDSLQWQQRPGWRDVIVVVSYLFASPTLDAEALFEDLERLLSRLGRGAVTLLYTNSVREEHNRQFPGFRRRLEEAEFRLRAEDQGEIVVERWDGPRERSLYYALLHRPQRRRLVLGE